MTFRAFNTYSFKINSFVPLLSMAVLCSFLVSYILDLGHYPLPSINDPKEMGSRFLYDLSGIGIFAFFICSTLWLMNLIVGIYYREVSLKHLIIFLIGLMVWVIQIVYDPGQIIYWYFD